MTQNFIQLPRQNVDHEVGNLALAFTEPLLSQYCEPEQNYPPVTYHIQQAVPVGVVPPGTLGPGTRIEYVQENGQPVNANLVTLSLG